MSPLHVQSDAFIADIVAGDVEVERSQRILGDVLAVNRPPGRTVMLPEPDDVPSANTVAPPWASIVLIAAFCQSIPVSANTPLMRIRQALRRQ